MAETQTKSAKGQDTEKAQEKKRRLEPAPVPMKVLADESISFPGLLGNSVMELPIERHAALLGDPRFSHSVNNSQKAGMVTELQQNYGNAYVQRVVGLIQAKKDEHLPEEEPDLAGIAQRIAQEKGSGQPLEPGTHTEMEASFGKDFSGVRMHTNSEADRLSKELGAKAFTTGKDVFFREGAYEPHSEAGRRLLAHELTHVVQQSQDIQPQREQTLQMQEGPKEEEAEPKETQSVYRIAVNMADDGEMCNIQVDRDIGSEVPNTHSYSYLEGAHGAWHMSTGSGGSLIPVKYAQEKALTLVRKAKDEIEGRTDITDATKAKARSIVAEIEARIPGCFTGRAKISRHFGTKINITKVEYPPPRRDERVGQYVGPAEANDQVLYEEGITMKAFYAVTEFMDDRVGVGFKPSTGAPRVKKPKPEAHKEEVPKIDVKNPIIIDGYQFNKYNLPKVGEGRVQLERLCNLDPDKKKGIIIGHITGHTDIVPVTRPGPRFKSLEELSLLRVKPVVDRLKQAKLGPPEIIEGLGDSEAEVTAPTATRKERAKDRKVVVYWYWQPPKK